MSAEATAEAAAAMPAAMSAEAAVATAIATVAAMAAIAAAVATVATAVATAVTTAIAAAATMATVAAMAGDCGLAAGEQRQSNDHKEQRDPYHKLAIHLCPPQQKGPWRKWAANFAQFFREQAAPHEELREPGWQHRNPLRFADYTSSHDCTG